MATNTDGREEIKPVAPTKQTKWRDPSLVGKYMVDPKTGLAGLFRSPDNGETWVLTDTVYGHVYNQDEVDNIWDNGAVHKVADEIKSATADLPNVRKQADSAVKFAESAIAASKVNSDAIVAQSSAVVEAKSAMDSATAEIQQLKANAASDVAQIESTIAKVQTSINQAKSANESAVQAVQAELKSTSDSMDRVEKRLNEVGTDLDTYAKSAAEQGHDITQIKQKQGQFEADFASAQGNVNQIQADIKGLRQNVKDNQGNIASLLTSADKLQASMTDAEKNISNLLLTASKYEQTFKDQDGRLSKVEQTATEHTSELADAKGNIDKVTQKADNLQLLLSDAQKNIQNIQLDAKGLHDTLIGQGNQLASLNVTLNSLDSKYSGITGDLQSKQTALSTEQQQTKDMLLRKADKSEVDNVKGTVSKVSAEQKVMADQISSKVSSADYQKDKTDTITAIEKNSTAIDETNKLVSIKADKTEVNNLNNTAQQISSRLDILAGEVKSKVDETRVNNIVDGKGYATTSTVQSLVDQKAGTINESITNLTSKVNGNNGGGVNLQGETDACSFPIGNNGNTTSIETYSGSTKMIHAKNGGFYTSYDVRSFVPTPGETYTLSADVKGDGVLSGGVFKYEGGDNGNLGTIQLTKDWKRISNTVHIDKVRGQWIFYPSSSSDFYLKHLKIERGSVATPWTPAPSDNATVTQVQSLTASIDGLQSRVTNYQNDTSSKYTQLSSLMQSKVNQGDLSSVRTQLANAINDRVGKGELMSQINLQAGNTLIQTGKLYLDSSSVVFSGRAFIPSAAISELDADKLTFYGNGSRATIGASVAQYDQDRVKSTINLQYQGGFEIHSSNQLGSILTMHDNTVRLASRSQTYSAGSGKPLDQQYSGFWAGSNHALINAVDSEGKTTGWSIGPSNSNGYRAYLYDSSTSVQPNYGVGIGTQRFDVYAGNSNIFLGPDKAELRGSEYATVHGNNNTYLEGGNQQIYLHNGEVNVGNPSDTGNPTGVHFRVFGWGSFNGYVEAMGWTTKSTLSSKTRIEPLDTTYALDRIVKTDLTTFQYREEVKHGMTKRHAGPIIDDVHDVAQYNTPDEFINERRTGRSDADVIGYLMGAVQELNKQIEQLKEKI